MIVEFLSSAPSTTYESRSNKTSMSVSKGEFVYDRIDLSENNL